MGRHSNVEHIDAKTFKSKTGFDPQQDDLHRANCNKAGDIGHICCGWCPEHDRPRFMCGCFVDAEVKAAMDMWEEDQSKKMGK